MWKHLIVTLALAWALAENVMADIFNSQIDCDSRSALFGPLLNINQTISGELFVATPGSAALLACSSLSNKLESKIALVVRGGGCTFAYKVFFAQLAGAKAVVVYDNDNTDELFFMADTSPQLEVNIYSFFVTGNCGIQLMNMYFQSINQTGQGPVVFANLSAADVQYFYSSIGSDFSSLGIVVGVYMGLSLIYWGLYFSYRRKHQEMKSSALRKLRKAKYARMNIPQIIAEAASPPVDLRNESSILADHEPKENVEEQKQDLENQISGAQTVEVKITSQNDSSVTGKTEPEGPSTPVSTSKPKSGGWLFGWKKNDNTSTKPIYDTGICTVCLEEFQDGEEILVLPCRHIFHDPCVMQWLEKEGACPFCKTPLLPKRQINTWSDYSLETMFSYPISQSAVLWVMILCLVMVIAYFILATTDF